MAGAVLLASTSAPAMRMPWFGELNLAWNSLLAAGTSFGLLLPVVGVELSWQQGLPQQHATCVRIGAGLGRKGWSARSC